MNHSYLRECGNGSKCAVMTAKLKPWPNGLASRCKLILQGNLHLVAKRTLKLPCKYMQVAKKKNFRQTYTEFHWLIKG